MSASCRKRPLERDSGAASAPAGRVPAGVTEILSRSRAVEDYLKAVYRLQQDSSVVATSALADALDRSAASVTNMVKGLAEDGLLEHTPYGASA
jgi:hypothetical protein